MRKFFIIYLFLFSINYNLTAQENEFNVGINGGVTIGNIEGVSSMALGFDANYLFDVFEGVKFGPSLNFIYFVTQEENGIKPDAFIYLPIGGSIKFHSEGDDFYVALDGGYAIGISPEGDNGGVFIKPMVGYNINENFNVNLFYSGVKKSGPTFGYIGLGVAFNIFGGNSYYSL
ncbi:conserved exported hypothetical protein [Tenacibaculum sp. 190524A05c]|uniref:hypothetical protein n=1 Tax=Tenacibaculum platacis TaxID=3137852 RepID=UPI0031FB81D0